MTQYNDAQKKAIHGKNRSLLASAGAGSGKTSVMTARVCDQLVNHRKSIEQMLIITFKNEAAYSMKEKLRKMLTEISSSPESSPFASTAANNALAKLPAANISTIHAFCLQVVRQGYMQVGIDPQASIVDDKIRANLFETSVRNAIENIASKGTRDEKRLFGYLKRALSVNDMINLSSEVHNHLMGIPDPYDRMHQFVEMIDSPASSHPWLQMLIDYNMMRVKFVLSSLADLKTMRISRDFPEKGIPYIDQDIAVLEQLEKDIDNGAVTHSMLLKAVTRAMDVSPALKAVRCATEPEKGVYEQYKVIHGEIKNSSGLLKEIRTDMEAFSKTNTVTCNKAIKNQLLGLEVLMREIGKSFAAIKNDNNVIDFSDLEQYAYRILTDTEHPDVRDSVRNKFTDVFVDECQDVSGIQYAIINALQTEKTNMFFVGDLKQSIYRFRHADPTLFLRMRESFSEDENADKRLIYFQENYRSSSTIISCVNAVFEQCMHKSLTEIDYAPGDHLIAAKQEIPSSPTEIIVVDNNTKNMQVGETKDKIEAQSVIVAEKITELVNSGYDYKDIVILLRSARTKGPQVCDWLTRLHIPAYYSGKQTYFDVPEVAMLVEILKCIDNGHQDIPLLTTLRNTPFGMTDEELAEIRAYYSPNTRDPFYVCFNHCADNNDTPLEQKCNQIRTTLDNLRMQAKISRASDMIWRLLKEFGIYAIQGAMPGGDMRQKNLYALHQMAISQEQTGKYRLSEFIGYINEVTRSTSVSGSGDVPAPLGEKDDFVRIMTIHASKGLEYPVVIIMDADRSIHAHKNSGITIQMDIATGSESSLGFYFPSITNYRGRVVRNSFGKNAFEAKAMLNELAEETRMLYVAMTRAQEKLIVVGCAGESDQLRWRIKNKESRIFQEKSALDMLMPAALDGAFLPDIGDTIENDLWKITYTRPHATNIGNSANAAGNAVPKGEKNDIDFDSVWKKRNTTAAMPAKTSVTSVISQKPTPVTETTPVTSGQEVEAELNVVTMSLPEEPDKPTFLQAVSERTSANVGTLFHRFMRILPFSDLANIHDKKQMLDELNKCLSGYTLENVFKLTEAEYVRNGLNGVAAFLLSDDGQKVLNNHCMREQGFTAAVSLSNETVLVQGVIDIMYKTETGHWVLLDYKTDHDARENMLIEKHKAQLNCYRMAVERISGIPVDEIKIVSLRTGMTYRVPHLDLGYCH